MLNFIKRWHRKTVGNIASAFGLPEDMSHHHQAHAKDFHHYHNQHLSDWHARHAAEVMTGTNWLRKWERFVYKQIRRIAR